MANEYYVISLSPEEVAIAIREYIWGHNPNLTSKIKLSASGAELCVALNQPVGGKEVDLVKRGGFLVPRLAIAQRDKK